MDIQMARAKAALDNVIAISRAHMYKPIQIAEILHQDRTRPGQLDLADLEVYRTASRGWRDKVSILLVGRASTSSARFQDDLFNENAVPPRLLTYLGYLNREKDGLVENYIYHRVKRRFRDLLKADSYVQSAGVDGFELNEFLRLFEDAPGLRRSVDKVYEIVVYALFATLVARLGAKVTLTLEDADPELLRDFEKFTRYVLGVRAADAAITIPVRMYRAGVTNAADCGFDIWGNYGAAVQVKHVVLSAALAGEIADSVVAEHVVIVCTDAEAATIQSLLNQIGLRIRGIVTQEDLASWYELCLGKYREKMADTILEHLGREFRREFPQTTELGPFLVARGYCADALLNDWRV